MRAKTHIRRRRRFRGAAMTEFLISAPMMITLWFGINYFRQGYARRLDTMSRSHAEAWQKAYSNNGECFKAGGGPWQGWTNSKGDGLNDADGQDSGVEDKFKGTSSMFIYGTVRSSSTEQTKGVLWNGSTTSSTFITCNEIVPATNKESATDSNSSGDDKYADQNVIHPMWDFVKSFFKF